MIIFSKPKILSNFSGKAYEKIIQHEAINVLTENNFFKEKIPLSIKKIRIQLKHCLRS